MESRKANVSSFVLRGRSEVMFWEPQNASLHHEGGEILLPTVAESGVERFEEMITLIDHLHINTHILGQTISNPVPFTGALSHDRDSLLKELREAKAELSEEQLRSYRNSIESL